MSDSVVVAVRCRPFNKREVALEAKCIVQMNGPKTTLVDPTGSTPPRDFTFDYSYWSFNSADAHFATNPKVYSDLGVSVLNNAWNGYNCCLFAYGQTGSGKSYSMVGYGEDRGIVPQAMEEMFKRIAANTDKNVKFEVDCSMIEIYNEKVRDLFNPDSGKSAIHGLKVRDHPQTGPYIEDLSRCLIKSYAEFSKLLEDGTAVRTVAATQMNATSSRAHTVFQIVFTKTTFDDETQKSSSTTSKINLVDLAGSERVAKTGASGQQLKEGIGINKSLTALGNCIEKLAKKSQVKKGGKDVHVPYRDSVLTWLLKESLGGNAKTIMIAAISPADDNYDESLSTLRYADRAKQIKNSAVVNEDENARMIRALKAEIQALKDALARGGGGGAPGAAGGAAGGMSGMSEAEKEEYLQLKEQMAQNEELVKKMNMSWEEKLRETEELAFKRAQALNSSPEMLDRKKNTPHMVNLHKDALMSGALSYLFPPGIIRLCTKHASPPPGEDDIVLSGLQVKPEHASIEHQPSEGGPRVFLTPTEGARTFVNGKLVKSRVELQHNDRLICGAHLVFRVIFPNHASDDDESKFDWEWANKELTSATIEALNQPDPETLKAQREQEEKIARMQAEIEAERAKSKEDQEKRQAEYEATLQAIAKKKEEEIAATKAAIEQAANAENQRALAKKLAEREAELERERAAAAKQHSQRLEQMRAEQQDLERKLEQQRKETQLLHKKHEVEKRDRALLEQNLLHAIPLVNEANAISTELGQPLRFSLKLEAKRSLDADGFTEHTDVWVRVIDLEKDLEILWTPDTLQEVLYEMREIYHNFMRSGEIEIPKNRRENPFYIEPSGPMLLGTARLYLQPCYFLLPINESVAVIDYRGEHKGQLYVNLLPIPPRDEDTMHLKEEELWWDEENVEEIKGEPLTMRLEIKKLMGLPQKHSVNTFVKYKFYYDDEDHSTDVHAEQTINPQLDYERTLLIDIVEDEFVEYVKNGILEFSVYGEQPKLPDEEEDEKADAKGKRSSGQNGGAQSQRLQQLEEVLRGVTSAVLDPESDDAKLDPDRILQESPELIAQKVAELRKKERALEEEVQVLKTPRKPARSLDGSQDGQEEGEAARLAEENARIKAELESLRRRQAGSAAESESDSTAALRAELDASRSALESLKKKSSPSAVELADKERALAAEQAQLLSLRDKFARVEAEAAELRALKDKEEALNRELQDKLAQGPAGADAELEQLRAELAEARARIEQSTPRNELATALADKDRELEQLKQQLSEAQSKKSKACVIL